MNAESLRIADQLRRAFAGDAWHGSPLRDLLAGVTSDEARARPLRHVHNIGELVLHIDVYVHVAFEATRGVPMPKLYGTERDWPALNDSTAAWTAAQDRMFQNAEKLAAAIEMLLNHRDLTVQDADAITPALAQFRRRPALGFSDCLILETARKSGHLPLGTFDRELGKLAGTRRL